MATGCGKVSLATVIWASGSKVKPMGTEYINGKMVIDMKALGWSALSMEKELIYFKMVICIQVITFKENLKAKVYTNGKMEVYILENSKVA